MKKAEVVAIVKGTTTNFEYTGAHISAQLFHGGRAVLKLKAGRDDGGPVYAVHFRRVEMVTIRETAQ